ncbi:MAG TPA: DUF1788 domain-containing protein [Planctomycetales bacterium]|jgi:hypothetical protein|nr:DUF1788 domain-containing protein [Planctomycetales bacterium]
MNRIELLKKNFQRLCEHSWDRNMAGAQRVWLAVYDKEDERKLRLRLGLFEEATHQTGHKWTAIDLTEAFPNWICGPDNADFAESYFESPDSLDNAALADLMQSVVARVRSALTALADPENTVLALYGVASLFGFLKISELLPMVEGDVKGRLLVFFPGVYEQNNYRLLDARDGWNYLAFPITASDVEAHSS